MSSTVSTFTVTVLWLFSCICVELIMKFFSCVADFAHTWQELASALWQRYPNPFR